jgi:iron complex transport system substrate-binding protein
MIMWYRSLFVILLYFVLTMCRDNTQMVNELGLQYAQGFTISKEKNWIRLTVRNPWEKARNIELEYYLVHRDSILPALLTNKKVIRIPAERIVCLSTSHLAFLDALGEINAVTGVSGAAYIRNPSVRERISEGKVVDVGFDQQLNYESIIQQHPDLVMVYGVDSEITGIVGKLHDVGIPAVYNAEYLEKTPLGKAEWIKYIAEFFRKEEKADSIFNRVVKNYKELKEKVALLKDKPVVMVGMPYRDAWWIPGGDSYLSKLIEDAGANYIASGNNSHESFVISLEEAFLKAEKSEFWINVGSVNSKTEILGKDSRFSNFSLFKSGHIYNNNKRSTSDGGNDFWESGAVFPDSILADLIAIFHPGILPGENLTYYKEIK